MQSTYGIGETYHRLPLALKVFFTLVIRPQVDDHEHQERLVKESGLDWTILRPVVLHDEPTTAAPHVAVDDRVPTMRLSRRQVARAAADALEGVHPAHRVLSVAAAATP